MAKTIKIIKIMLPGGLIGEKKRGVSFEIYQLARQ